MAARVFGRLKGLLQLCCVGLAFSQLMLQTDLKTVLIWDNMQRPLQIKFLPSGQVGRTRSSCLRELLASSERTKNKAWRTVVCMACYRS
jgi:hypothetical protein